MHINYLKFVYSKFILDVYNPVFLLKRNFGTVNSKVLRNKMSESLPNCSIHEASILPTAGLIVIGDEILKGQVLDTNTKFLTEELYKLNVKVEKVSIIPDDIRTIAEEVALFSEKYTHVLTSGGIGPTHDDVTFEGVAAAFKESLYYHPSIVQFLQQWYDTTDMNSPAMKMAKIPRSAILHFGEDKKGVKWKFPIVSVRNVVIFPGIPHLLTRSFGMLGRKLFGHNRGGFFTSKLYSSSDEVSLVDKLNDTVTKFPQITFGSYPELFNSYYRTKVTLESLEADKLKEAENYLRSKMDKDSVVEYIADSITDPWNYISRLSPPILSLFNAACDKLDQCFERYKPEDVCICYNGGKDCLVALHILHTYMKRFSPEKRIQAVYITEKSCFPQVTEFVNESISRYNLDCDVIPGPMKTALATLMRDRPAIKAVIMGTRRVDPHGESLKLFSPTDGDWPPVMRINPILEWKYDEIWSFIRQLFLPYCSLYDRGYTSLGSIDNTLPNPSLERRDSIGRVIYLPAYELQDPNLERKGRIS